MLAKRKGGKPKGAKGPPSGRKGQEQQEKASVRERRVDDATKQCEWRAHRIREAARPTT